MLENAYICRNLYNIWLRIYGCTNLRKTMPFAIFWILMNGLMVFLGLHVI